MINRGWGNLFGNQNSQMMNMGNMGMGNMGMGGMQNQMPSNNFFNNQTGNVQNLPTQVSPTQYSNPRVSPTQQYLQRNITNNVVPHVHPSHLTTVNQENVINQHYFPHTNSVEYVRCEKDVMCGHPFNPWQGHGNCGKCNSHHR